MARWRANFLAGLAVVMPVVISLGIILWLFGTVSNITDTLLFFIPQRVTHQGAGTGPMHWYWSVVAFLLAVALIAVVGRMARNFIGRQMIQWMDALLLRVPLLNKIYSTIKQVNEAFSLGRKGAFQTVALIEFPRQGMYSLGFITSEQSDEIQARTREKLLCVFIPTTPNPTSGYLVMVPEQQVTKLDMSIAEAVRFIISLGSVSPPHGKSLPAVPPVVPPPQSPPP
jgi:uncharacterized membrane protein